MANFIAAYTLTETFINFDPTPNALRNTTLFFQQNNQQNRLSHATFRFSILIRNCWIQRVFLLLIQESTVHRTTVYRTLITDQEPFLKLFLMAPRLVLFSTRGVARRARLLLSGSVQAFEYLLEESSPSDRGAHYLMSETRRQKRTEQRVSELIKSCDLSRALNALHDKRSRTS